MNEVHNIVMFRTIWQGIYEVNRVPLHIIEGVMNMFSRELFEMDRNTAQLMVDDFSKKITQLEKDVAEKDNTIAEKDNTIAVLQARIKELENK